MKIGDPCISKFPRVFKCAEKIIGEDDIRKNFILNNDNEFEAYDDLDEIEIIMEVENEFGCIIYDNDIENIAKSSKNLKEFIENIGNHLKTIPCEY